ncbi:unnamed protein product [Ectocarpus sp. 12 AP-2014]
MPTQAIKLPFQQQEVWPGHREQLCLQHDVGTGEPVPTIHDFPGKPKLTLPSMLAWWSLSCRRSHHGRPKY